MSPANSILLFAGLLAVAAPARASTNFLVTDIFGRDLATNGITLTDWEGQMANPLIRFHVRAPADASLPASATLSASGVRLYFDNPSDTGPTGPSKIISFTTATSSVPVGISIFPDRDSLDENYTLAIRLNGANRTNLLPIHVVDQDRPNTDLFNVITVFSQDITGFFDDPLKRAVARQAAEDWAYFIDDMHLDPIPAQAESTWIWDTNAYTTGYYTNNPYAYTGYLLYAYGVITPQHTSGGGPNFFGRLQTSGGVELPLKCSGGYDAEIVGNYNTNGWYVSTNDDDWWISSNLGDQTNDLASIAHHEIGHALIFNPGYPLFNEFKTNGAITDPALTNYYGAPVPIDSVDHLNGVLDPASQKGVFGYEYYGNVPANRWLISKLDLLVAQAIGYKLRMTSAFLPLQIATNALLPATLGAAYSQSLIATGGIPFYCWDIVSGALPNGLQLDSFSGTIHGQPASAGTFNFTVRLRDYGNSAGGVSAPFTLLVPGSFQFDSTGTSFSNNVFTSRLIGPAGQKEIIQVSTNLSAWQPLVTNSTGLASFDFSDTNATSTRRFYRAMLAP